MEIKLFTNQNAKNYMIKVIKIKMKTELEPEFFINAKNWLDEINEVKCYALCNCDKIVTLILLSKCNFDPYEQHEVPFTLNYIYTFPEFRRKNFACKMLLYVKKKEQMTAYCSNEESENLFKKAEFVFSGNDLMMNVLPVYRFP